MGVGGFRLLKAGGKPWAPSAPPGNGGGGELNACSGPACGVDAKATAVTHTDTNPARGAGDPGDRRKAPRKRRD